MKFLAAPIDSIYVIPIAVLAVILFFYYILGIDLRKFIKGSLGCVAWFVLGIIFLYTYGWFFSLFFI